MKVDAIREMIEAARRAEFDYYQRGRQIGAERHIPTPDAIIRAMLEGALSTVPEPSAEPVKAPAIVKAKRPPRRR
jgi:hypothetical protein